MISRFFIDRPVFAIVLSLVIVLAGGGGGLHAAGGPISRGDAPHRAGDGHLPGGQRA